MLRHPLATVLSSVSIRNLLSIRRFCAPASSADDQIPTVRVTGSQSVKDGIDHTSIGVYWGDGDKRNVVKHNKNHDVTDYRQVQLRSILNALNTAKERGLKRVRVQTDFEFEKDGRTTIESFTKHQLEKQNGAPSLISVYGKEILNLMDKLEVIIEYRRSNVKNSAVNEVLRLLDSNTIKSARLSKMRENGWTITPKDVLPLEGKTVPTVYVVGRLHFEGTVGAYAHLWVPESIDHLDIKPRSSGWMLQKSPARSLLQFQAFAIAEAIKNAQLLKISEIRVITDAPLFVLFKKDKSLQKYKIEELIQTTKVHFQGIEFTKEDEWLNKAYHMTNAFKLKSEKKLLGAPETADDDKITTVRATGVQWMKDGVASTMIGVYWGCGDKRNRFESRRNHDVSNSHEVRLRPILIALQLAKKDGLKRICVQTDFGLMRENTETALQAIINSHLKKNNERSVINGICKQILTLMNEMELTFEFREFVKDSTNNEVMQLLLEDREMHYPNRGQTLALDWTITPKDALPLEGRIVPTVYAVGRLHFEGTVGAYGCLWVSESIDHLKIKPKSSVSTLQKSDIRYITLLQSQMVAIEEAIFEARLKKIPEIRVMTDSLQFVKSYQSGWKRPDGSTMSNERLYLKIKKLTETTKVHFKGVKFAREDEWLNKAYQMTNAYAMKLEKK